MTIKYFTRIISSDPDKINSRIVGSIKENSNTIDVPNVKYISAYKSKQKSSKVFSKTLLVLFLGWISVIYIALYMTKEEDMSGRFDPYAILDVSFSSSEKEVKSHYRKLSLKYHPDKLPRDLTDEARMKMEQEYIRLTSAYKALTDDATRENYIRYGHPDGEQPITHGIALPTFLVEGKYSSIVVVLYFILIGLLLPVLVGKWWNNVKNHTRKGLHVKTAANIVLRFADKDPAKIITCNTILDYVLESEEVLDLVPELSLAEKRLLVESHFDRKVGLDKQKEKQKVELVAILPFLIDGLIDIAVAFRLHEAVFAAEDLKKAVIQAVKPTGKYQEILQLPFVNEEVVVKQPVKKLGKLLTLSQEEAKAALGIESKEQLEKALSIAKSLFSLRVVDAQIMVPGEDGLVLPNSNAHLSVKFLVKSPKLKSCPEIDDARLKDEETLEYMKNPMIVNEQQPRLPFAYAPYFPQAVRNKWACYIIAQKENKLVDGSTSYFLENIDLSNLSLSQKDWENGEKVVIGTFKIPLPTAVGNVGKYHYRLVMKCNSYYGGDVDIPVDLEVSPIPKEKSLEGIRKVIEARKKMEAAEDEDEDEDEEDSDSDISDPEEDSLSGALAVLRGEIVKKAKKVKDEDEDEDEDVFTDINTDTEDEAE
ncbi:SEC63 [Candida oxycetoniae]|uniref:SEC63 n=1 Tax=Candida oxycetoniae TaxID=497107 RepID=A0AAI9T047_9ASCO|nr:SEC63 [Candida oxycetoniae]KAI3405990.2 SEC63 [Candida oxycetoniae]